MEVAKMRKISIEKAQQLIKDKEPVMAKLSTSRDPIPVTTLTELGNLIRLKNLKVQDFELFKGTVTIPENAIELSSLDDAIELIDTGEKVFSKQGKKEISFSSVNDVIEFYRHSITRDGVCHLYWYV